MIFIVGQRVECVEGCSLRPGVDGPAVGWRGTLDQVELIDGGVVFVIAWAEMPGNRDPHLKGGALHDWVFADDVDPERYLRVVPLH